MNITKKIDFGAISFAGLPKQRLKVAIVFFSFGHPDGGVPKPSAIFPTHLWPDQKYDTLFKT